MSLSIKQIGLLDGYSFLSHQVPDRCLRLYHISRGWTYLAELVLVRSFLFAPNMVLVCYRLHDHPITFFIQHIFLVGPLISPANSIQSEGRRRCILCYGDKAKDNDLGGNEQLPCHHMLTYGSNGGTEGGVGGCHYFAKKRYCVTWQVPTPNFCK